MNSDACRDFIKEAGETCRPVTEIDNTAIGAFIFVCIGIALIIRNLIKENNEWKRKALYDKKRS